MPRIPYPADIATAPEASQPLLQAVEKQLGSVPNLFRLAGVSPAALEGYLGLFGALGKGRLPAATRERVALAVAQANGCSYCLSAHSYLGKTLANLDETEIAANRLGRSNDARADAALRFAVEVLNARGRVADDNLRAIRDAGYDDGQIIEIVQHVALNIWTNYLNELAGTEIDFPAVDAGDLAA
ncbi:carboxymuconolactone decarboxylase family protein [Acidimangrovimonas pyrenivorans]|uniref:Carboxymuconolactone decarboxylase family protein n=1 Tax=Acidimangrovimonas pyrenivorans TaxID=2030798 RepID=A0ABV7AGQ1_9RHOB